MVVTPGCKVSQSRAS